jgi:hypothetical protein
MTVAARRARIGILIVADNAAGTPAAVLDRIPKEFIPQLTGVLMCEDASPDSAYLIGVGYREIGTGLRLRIVGHPVNVGYGGNQ